MFSLYLYLPGDVDSVSSSKDTNKNNWPLQWEDFLSYTTDHAPSEIWMFLKITTLYIHLDNPYSYISV